ncbi:hypothetical protein OKN36_21670 [Furfurilactobacillus sp. OKN36]
MPISAAPAHKNSTEITNDNDIDPTDTERILAITNEIGNEVNP